MEAFCFDHLDPVLGGGVLSLDFEDAPGSGVNGVNGTGCRDAGFRVSVLGVLGVIGVLGVMTFSRP